MTDRTRVVVTGLGAVSACGVGVDTLFDGLVAGRSGIGPITLYDASEHPIRIAGEATGYSARDHFERKELRRIGRFSQFAMVAAREAVAHAGLDLAAVDLTRIGTIVGSGIGDFETVEEQLAVLHRRGPAKINPFTVPKAVTNMAAANIAMEFGMMGPSFGATAACSTGSVALGLGVMMIRSGFADVVVAGGTEACLSPGSVLPYNALRALSTRECEPERASCPFDSARDGFIVAEGAGILVLESEEHATARGAKPIVELAGISMNCDAHHITSSPEDGSSPARAMTHALADAGLVPTDIDYVNAHGTSTPLNDPTETRALKVAFGEHAHRVAISSSKSMIGHALGAAGAVEAVATVRTITDGIIPPTINLENPDPECDLDYVPNVARKAVVRHAMSNSFGFGGQNGVLVFRAVS
ncbi:MAG: beta-ketoacyl-ACP synthase II [Planctomycetota bacterium]